MTNFGEMTRVDFRIEQCPTGPNFNAVVRVEYDKDRVGNTVNEYLGPFDRYYAGSKRVQLTNYRANGTFRINIEPALVGPATPNVRNYKDFDNKTQHVAFWYVQTGPFQSSYIQIQSELCGTFAVSRPRFLPYEPLKTQRTRHGRHRRTHVRAHRSRARQEQTSCVIHIQCV